jgi:biopolymer transport protein ExbB/TolQ
MGILTNIFYLISTSLLIPVMLTLLWCLVRGLLLAGKMLREYSARATAQMGLAQFSRALEEGDSSLPSLDESGLVARTLTRLIAVADNATLSDKIVHDCQLTWQADVERLRSLARLGPALGLMGTLIPLGPALVGLAAGDLQMMSQNLVIAFATTVVGLLVGTLATTLAGVKKRWYQADAVLVTFAANRITQLKSDVSERDAIASIARVEPTGGNGESHTCGGACACAGEANHV